MQENDLIEERVNIALQHRKDNDLTAMMEELEDIDKEHPDNGVVLNLLAHAQWECGLLKEAEGTARRCIKDTDHNESASLILFHCLWGQKRYNEAMEEIARFQKTERGSDDYAQFLKFVSDWRKKRKEFDFSDLDKYRQGTTASAEVVGEAEAEPTEADFEGAPPDGDQ